MKFKSTPGGANHRFWFGGLAALILAAEPTLAAPVTFENGSADYDDAAVQTTGLFRDAQNGANISLLTASGNTFLRHAGATGNISATTLYDTTPNDTTPATHSKFVNEQVTVDFRLNSSSSSFGIYSRLNDAATDGYAIVLNINNSGSNDQIRIFDSPGPDANTGGVGSTLLVNNGTTTALTTSTWYTLVAGFDNLSNGNVEITTRVYAQGDVNGTALMNFSVIDTTTPLINAGQVALRFGDNSSTAVVTADADNFDVGPIPEPGTLGGIAAAAMVSLARRRRRF